MEGQLKQYGIKHYVSGTIYFPVSGILPFVDIYLSMAYNNY